MGTGVISKTVQALITYVHRGTNASPQFVPVFPIVSVLTGHVSVQLITVAMEESVMLSGIKMEMQLSSVTVPMGSLEISVMMSVVPILAQMARYT